MMMLIPKRRFSKAVGAALLALLCGAGLGYWSGRLHTQRASEEKLVRLAQEGVSPFIALVDEASGLLTKLNTSPYPHCSPEEIAFLREQIFHSVTLHDAGHMRDGRLLCSALYGREHLSAEVLKPTVTRADGLKIYRNIPPFQSTTQQVYLLQKDDSFVVEDPGQYSHWSLPTIHYESSYLDAITHRRARPGGAPLAYPDAVLDREYRGFIGKVQYVTICQPQEFICTSAFESFPEILWADRVQIVTRMLVGALTGLVVALLCILLMLRSRSMTQQLRRAIRQQRIEVVYQPIVELASGRIVAAEALARWTDEDGFSVNPEIFVHFAEENGFIDELTEFVVRRTVSDMSVWLRRHPEFSVNINVTATDLEKGKLLGMLDRYLRDNMLAARCLAIEVTEGSTAGGKVAVEAIQRLREQGHSVLVDDFGTGYSSLAYLKDLAIDAIKIDKAFTQAIGTDAVTSTILPQMLSMAEALHLQVVVEGIETAEQAAYFVGMAQPILGQGWFFGYPGPAEEMLQELERREEEALRTAS